MFLFQVSEAQTVRKEDPKAHEAEWRQESQENQPEGEEEDVNLQTRLSFHLL